ncbi:uncharacterized protein LOC114726246 [Neltuma alba]|uniref:uncharacterized protein LOC114726246 n=1 Tax=Neltuma alba TaxID=207710 RepID=UPI0010A47549|nr:uncharacterized protein LOC114726246 [Prosopis alba]
MVPETQEEPRLSYREALKPKTNKNGERSKDSKMEDAWDGNLLYSDENAMKEGVTVLDTDHGPQINFTEKERRRLEQSWQNSLIVKLLGGNTGFMQLRRKLQVLWGKSGNVDLSVIGNGYMIATFQELDDYYWALEGGPWIIQNSYLTVQTWKRNFNPWNEKIQKVTVWVRLPGLPGDYYDRKFFYNLGNKIGTAIRVDEMTLSRARTMYARMCVEVDLNAPLLGSYTIDGNRLKIEYEGLQIICYHCGRFGHDHDHCPSKQNAVQKNTQAEDAASKNADKNGVNRPPEVEQGSRFGEWMLAQPSRRGRRPMQKEGQNVSAIKGLIKESHTSRYAALESEEADFENKEKDGMVRKPPKDMSSAPRGKEKKGQTDTQPKKMTDGQGRSSKGRKPSGKKVGDIETSKDMRWGTEQIEAETETSIVKRGKEEASRLEKAGKKKMEKSGPEKIGQGEKRGEQQIGPKEIDTGLIEGNQLGQYRSTQDGPPSISGGRTKNHAGNNGLDSLPNDADEVMGCEEEKPPDSDDPMEGVGLAELESHIEEQRKIELREENGSHKLL